MEGEGERKRETEMGSEKANTSAYCTHTHAELSRWIAQSIEVGFIPSSIPLRNSPLFKPPLAHVPDPSSSFFSFPLSAPPLLLLFPPWSDYLLFLLLLSGHVWGLFKHNLFPLVSPGSIIQPFYCCVFSPSLLSASLLFVYSWMSVLLLIVLQRIRVGFVSALLGFI